MDFYNGLKGALNLIVSLDRNITEIVLLSLYVSFMSTFISSIIALPTAIIISVEKFKFKKQIINIINTFMAIPPVIAGLIVYILFSRNGIFKGVSLLFTPTAMIIAQIIILVPLIIGTSINIINTKGEVILDELYNLNADKISGYRIIFSELKNYMFSNVLLGFSRAISEVGAVMLVGGNIQHKTRVMTTYIVLQTNMGNFDGAIAIGIILLLISYIINLLVNKFSREV